MAVDSNIESLSPFITFVLVRQISNSNSATPQTCKTLAAIPHIPKTEIISCANRHNTKWIYYIWQMLFEETVFCIGA